MKITILFNHCSRRSKIRGFLIILWHFNGVVVCTFIRIMEKLRDIFCALLLALNMSHMGDSRLYVPNWDRGLESCPVPSFDNVKVSKRFFKTSCCRSYLKKKFTRSSWGAAGGSRSTSARTSGGSSRSRGRRWAYVCVAGECCLLWNIRISIVQSL